MKKPIVWTIAGSDTCAGAGIQADLLTFHDFGVSPCSIVTAITAQNSFAVGLVEAVSKKTLVAQINALDSDLPAKVIKLGMLAATEVVETVSRYLEDFSGKGLVVCDPVLKASAGGDLLEQQSLEIYKTMIIPKADVLTPNLPETEILLDRTLKSIQDVELAAKNLVEMGAKNVVIKGGHHQWLKGFCADYCLFENKSFWLLSPHQDTIHSHGTGCTFASALAAGLANGFPVEDAVVLAKAYINKGLRLAEPLGSGPGAVAHEGLADSLEDMPWVIDSLNDYEPGLIFPRTEKNLGLYPVVDSVEWLEKLLALGITTIQLRIKNEKNVDVLREQIQQAVKLQHQYSARLFINDYWQMAVEESAYGVHLGQEDLSTAELEIIARAGVRLGLSTHSWWEICRAHACYPSYIAIGPIYSTTTKEMKFAPQGIKQLEEWVSIFSDYPTVAIGGINQQRIAEVLESGVDSVAVVTAITEAEDYKKAVACLSEAFQT